MKKLLILSLITMLMTACGPKRHRTVPAGGLQDFGDGTFGVGVKDIEDLQTILLLNNCGLEKPCTFMYSGQIFRSQLGDTTVYFSLNSGITLKEFQKTLGCGTLFVCAYSKGVVVIEAQRKQ